MRSARRVLLDSVPSGDEVVLAGPEARRLHRVLRIGPGDRLVASLPDGTERTAEVVSTGPREVRLRLVGPVRLARAATIEVSVAVSVPKGKRMDYLVEKCTEAGASGIAPVVCARSEAGPADLSRARLERWRRIAKGAARQCGRPAAPRVEAPLPLAEALTRAETDRTDLLLDPEADEPLRLALESAAPARLRLFVGPEGGWTPMEREAFARARAHGVTLGPTVLRIETAAALACGIAVHWALRPRG